LSFILDYVYSFSSLFSFFFLILSFLFLPLILQVKVERNVKGPSFAHTSFGQPKVVKGRGSLDTGRELDDATLVGS
jgi:hypothetical protein